MKKFIVGIVSSILIVVAGISNSSTETQQPVPDTDKVNAVNSLSTTESSSRLEVKSVCDGISVTENCEVEGVKYSKYVYHPAVPEKTRTESITTYKEEVADYCTLCRDGTYSPSCATGRGACSWHGGVAQWNAPRYRKVPVTNTRTIVDVPAKDAYYEKVEQTQ